MLQRKIDVFIKYVVLDSKKYILEIIEFSMHKAIKKIIRYTSFTALLAYGYNNIVYPVSLIFDKHDTYFDKRIQEKTDMIQFTINYKGSAELRAYHYLKASAIAMSGFIKYGEPGGFPDSEETLEYAIKTGIGDCYVTTQFTYSNFIHLAIIKNDRWDRLEKIIAAAQSCPVMAIEIYKEGKQVYP